MSRRATRIALFSPFWGANLGDAAILRAMIDNLRRHDPQAQFAAITMDPASMKRTHGVEGMAMPGWGVRFFSYFDPETVPTPGLLASLKRIVKNTLRLAKNAMLEARHTWRAMRFLKGVDLLVVAGGGQFDEEWGGPWGLPYCQYKWTWLARLAGAHVVFLSVGVCKIESDRSKSLLRRALRRSSFVSLRDEWSKNFVQKELHRQDAQRVPDAAFAFRHTVGSSAPAASGPLKVGISPIAYGRPDLWPTLDPDAARRYFAALIEFSRQRLVAGDVVTLFSTDGPDRILVSEMRTALAGITTPEQQSRIEIHEPRTVEDLLVLLAPLDIVIASRLHGIILSHLLQRPALAISYDRKVAAHMSDGGMDAYCMEFADTTVQAISERFDRLAAERDSVHRKLLVKTAAWEGSLADQYKTVMDLLLREAVPERPGT